MTDDMIVIVDEEQLELRDDRVSEAVNNFIRDERAEARELRQLAEQCERRAARIESAVQRGQWWELAMVPTITRDDIESLSELSPHNLLEEK